MWLSVDKTCRRDYNNKISTFDDFGISVRCPPMNIMFSYLRPSYGRMSVGLQSKYSARSWNCTAVHIEPYSQKRCRQGGRRADRFMGRSDDSLRRGALWCNIIANRIAARVACDFSLSMRQDLFDKSIRISAAQTDAITLPSLESRITTDTYNVHSFVSMMLRMGIRGADAADRAGHRHHAADGQLSCAGDDSHSAVYLCHGLFHFQKRRAALHEGAALGGIR